jgi:hypothetical protein
MKSDTQIKFIVDYFFFIFSFFLKLNFAKNLLYPCLKQICIYIVFKSKYYGWINCKKRNQFELILKLKFWFLISNLSIKWIITQFFWAVYFSMILMVLNYFIIFVKDF